FLFRPARETLGRCPPLARAADGRRSCNSSHFHVDCVTCTNRSQPCHLRDPLTVDLSRDSAHKACIAILADEHHHESRHDRGALRRSTSSRELLGHLSNVIETLGPSRPASASPTPLT